jgi:hypothetical protein
MAFVVRHLRGRPESAPDEEEDEQDDQDQGDDTTADVHTSGIPVDARSKRFAARSGGFDAVELAAAPEPALCELTKPPSPPGAHHRSAAGGSVRRRW